MTETLRRFVLVTVMLAGATTASAQAPDLSFLGFEAGAPLAAVAAQADSLDGNLECPRSRTDAHVRECRGTIIDSISGAQVQLWLSSADSLTSVLTISGTVDGDQLDQWRSDLVSRFGAVGARVQGPQWMMQWVRRGRMLRLTWRVDGNTKRASVSLIDGAVLDQWGRNHERQAGRR
jgi:hypothetical protein